MTLHWWMHWFWVTMHVAVTLTSPMPSLAPVSTNATTENPAYKNTSLNISQTTEILAEIQRNYRGAKSVNLQVPTLSLPLTNLTTENVNNNETADELRNIITTTIASSSSISSSLKTTTLNYSEDLENNTVGPKKDIRANKITIKPLRPKSQEIPSHEAEIMAVVPLQSVEEAKPKSLGNIETTNWSQSQINWTDSMTSESVATVTSLSDGGSSDATRLGRARGTFSNELQRNQIYGDDRIRHNNNNNSNNVIKDSHESNTSATEIAAITGSCLAMVILLSTVGSLGFIMYRRKYLNPPQTLNSDKCSNPDSSGYIDDSTIRENSEEMYSLDNDSFLNSLEAMTIQNYWTDSVKHTKL